MSNYRIDLTKLRDLITRHFNQTELRNLCFDLHIDHEALPAETQPDLAREVVAFCWRHGRLDDLHRRCQQLRPKANWDVT